MLYNVKQSYFEGYGVCLHFDISIILGVPGRGDTNLSRVSIIWIVSVALVYAFLVISVS